MLWAILTGLQARENTSAIVIMNPSGDLVVSVKYDGSVEYGPGFTTKEAATRQFWETMGRTFKESA